MERKGDPTKQPPECEPRFTRFSADFPRDPLQDTEFAEGRWTRCPNLQETGGGMSGEQYECAVCGKAYFLDYDEMR